jgi:MFS family permease
MARAATAARERDGDGMRARGFAGRHLDFGRDIRLFLAYTFLANIGFGVFALIFNLYVYALDFREDAIGVFNSVQTFSMAATAVMLGTLIGRLGLWRVIVAGVAVYGLSAIGLALSTWAPAIILLSACFGAGIAILFTITMPFIIEYGRLDQRTNIATVAFSFASLSLTLGSLIGGYAPIMLSSLIPSIEAGSPAAYRAALIAGSLIGLGAIIPLMRMGDARRSHRNRGATAGMAEPERPTRRAKLDTGVFVAVGGIMAIGAGLVVPFYNVYLQTLGANPRQIGLIYAAGGIAAAVIGLGAPLVSRHLGSLNAVAAIRCSALPFYLLLVVFPGFGIAVVAHIVRQVSINMAWPVDSTFASELLSGKLRASVFGWRSAAWNLGIGLASIAGGWIIVETGYRITFIGYVFFTFAAMALYTVYYFRHPRVAAGAIPSALSSRERARRAVAQTEAAVGTIDGALPGTIGADEAGMEVAGVSRNG